MLSSRRACSDIALAGGQPRVRALQATMHTSAPARARSVCQCVAACARPANPSYSGRRDCAHSKGDSRQKIFIKLGFGTKTSLNNTSESKSYLNTKHGQIVTGGS